MMKEELEKVHFSNRQEIWTAWEPRLPFKSFFLKGHNTKIFWNLWIEYPVIVHHELTGDELLDVTEIGICF